MPSRIKYMVVAMLVVVAMVSAVVAVAVATATATAILPGTYGDSSLATNTLAATTTNVADKKISDPNYQNARIVNVKDFGAHSIDEPGYEKYDSTAAIQAAINSMPTVAHTVVGKGTWAIPKGKLVIPAGNWNIPGGLTIPNTINLLCEGVLNGDVVFNSLAPKDYIYFAKIEGLACNNLIIYPSYQSKFIDIKVKYQLKLAGANALGLLYNEFDNISANSIVLDVTGGYINQNNFNNVTAFGDGNTYGLRLIGSTYECQNNVFTNLDCSFGKGIINDSEKKQNNTIYGLYMESGTGQTIAGNWNVIAPSLPYAGSGTPIQDTWQNSLILSNGDRAGEHISMSTRNKALGGEWDLIQYGNMACVHQPDGKGTIGTDSTNPAGTEMVWGDTFSQGQTATINLGKFPAGYMNAAILYKGSIGAITTGVTSDGTDAITGYDLVGTSLGNGWNLLHISRSISTNNPYSIVIHINAGSFSLGGIVASSGRIVGLPTASPTSKEIVSVTQGTVSTGSELDITIPFTAHFTDAPIFNYSIVDSGAFNTNNLVTHYLKSVSTSSAVVHVKYTGPFSCVVQGEATGNIK